MATYKFLVFLSHHEQGCFYYTYHPIVFSIYLWYLFAHFFTFPFELITPLRQTVVVAKFKILQIFAICFNCGKMPQRFLESADPLF